MSIDRQFGLMISVYRDARLGDCSNNGITATAHTLLLVGEDVPEIFCTDGHMPVVRLVSTKFGLRLIPEAVDSQHAQFGGTFGYSSDSRFAELLSRRGYAHCVPIKIFDRVE